MKWLWNRFLDWLCKWIGRLVTIGNVVDFIRA